jgi:hypothetical protein
MLTHFSQGAYDDELVDRYIKRVPGSVATAYLEAFPERQEGEDLEPALRGLDVPLLLAEHRGCLLFTPEGYEEAVATFPEAARLLRPQAEREPGVRGDAPLLLPRAARRDDRCGVRTALRRPTVRVACG